MTDSIENLETQLPLLTGEARIDALFEITESLLLRDYERAFRLVCEGLSLAEELKDIQRVAEGLRRKGRVEQRLAHYASSEESYNQALTLFKEFNDAAGQASCKLGLANIYLLLNQHLKALELYLEVLPSFQGLGLKREEGVCLMNIGISYSFLGEYSVAVEYYLQALNIAETDSKNIIEIAVANYNIGDALRRLQQLEESFEYCQRVLQTGKEKNLIHLENMAAISIGKIHILAGEHTKALPLLERALELSRELKDPIEEIRTLKGLCQVHSALGHNELTQQYYEQGLALTHVRGNPHAEISLQLTFGKHLLQAGDAAGALEVFQHALALSENINLPAEICRAHESLAYAYKQQTDYQQAFFHFELYHELQQRLNGEKQIKQSEALLVRQEVKKTREIAEMQRLLNEQLAEANQKLEQTNAELVTAYRQNQELLAQVQYQANHDRLTGLPNRNLFEDRLEQSIMHAARYDEVFAVMFLDLDGFKQVNDTLGHDAGDELLMHVAERFQNVLRESDTIARLGGDEFTIIISNLVDDEGAATVAEKLLSSLDSPFLIRNHRVSVGVSIGVSLFPADGRDIQTLQKHADIAMYHIKHNGKRGFSLFSQNIITKINNQAIEHLLQKA